MRGRQWLGLVGIVAFAASCTAVSGLGDLERAGCTSDCDGSPGDGAMDGRGADARNDGGSRDGARTADGNTAADAPSDAPTDTPLFGDGGCGNAFRCGMVCVTDCAACMGSPLACTSQGICVPSCTGCAEPIECYQCSSGGNRPGGTCTTTASACTAGSFTSCRCTAGDAALCPGATQVCASDLGTYECVPCGATATTGKLCKSGRQCDGVTGTCR